MAQLIWTLSAINDLDSIGEYIRIDSEIAAKKFVKEIIAKADTLAVQPLRGRPIPEKIPGDTDKFYTRVTGLFTKWKMRKFIFPQFIIRKDYYLKLTITKCPTEQSLLR